MPTSIDRNSKPDTVLLSLPNGAGAAALAVDLSQYRDNLTNATTYVHESPSVRTAITTPREISVVGSFTSKLAGVILEHGNGAGSYTYKIELSGGVVEFRENGALRVSVALPGVEEDDGRDFLLHWSTRPESFAVRSEVMVYNIDDGLVEHAHATHLECTTSAAYNLAIGDEVGGGNDIGAERIKSVRIGRRFHSTAEGYEDWIGETSPPTMTQTRRSAVLVPDRSTLDIANDGTFAGPAHLWSGHTFLHNDRRLVGYLVNTIVLDPARITNDYLPTNFWRTAPGDDDVHLFRPLSWNRPVPGKVNRARVRLFVRQTIEIGTETAEVRYRCYSIDNLPIDGQPAQPLTYYRTAPATCDVNHGTGPGEWLDLGTLPLAIDQHGYTWLAIGIEFDEDSELVGDTDTRISAVTIEPYYAHGGNGGGLDIIIP